jgi:transposase
MVTIGVDPHKQTHTAVAADRLGRELDSLTVPARRDGFGALLAWAKSLDSERVWVIEDCRHVSGGLERFLLDFGETVIRLPPALMAGARQSVRERGKSDPIDALAVARAALREGLQKLPAARLAGPELEIRQLVVHRRRLTNARTRLINELRWQLHDLWPDWEIPPRSLHGPAWQQRISDRLRHADPSSVRVRIARDEVRRIKDLTRTINRITSELSTHVHEVAPQLLVERGLGVITAATLIGEIAGIERFHTDAQLARISGCAPIPVSSGRTDRHRLDPGGNRQLNHAFHMLALSKLHYDPQTAVYIAKQRAAGKTRREAIRCLKRHLVRRIYGLLTDPNSVATTICLT